jgi:glycosyltransferase involved in cell wall biosynthesis
MATVEQLDIADSVVFVGPVTGTEKARVLKEAGVFCFPSFYAPEGQPLVVIEAMAASLPVVATKWRGIADTVIEGETGLLVPEPSPDLIAEKLVYLADNPEERERLGSAGLARYEHFYTQRAFGERMIKVLGLLIDGGDDRVPVPAGRGTA